MKKVIVLGSNSFSGSDFISLLLEKNKYRVVGISRSAEKNKIFQPFREKKQPNYRCYRLDLNKDFRKIEKVISFFHPDYVVNFAAQSEVAPSWQHPEHWFETNTVSLSRLINFLRTQVFLTRYVHISSPEIYGTCRGVVKEDAPLNPSTPYAASKAAADLLISTYIKNYRFPAVFVRSTNVYGAGQQLFKIIPRTVIYIKAGRKIELHGGGKAVKSYIHIRDVSKGEFLIMEKGKNGEIYHLSPDKGISVRIAVKIICRKMGVDFKKATVEVEERLGQDKAYVIDSSKIRHEFGWLPEISFKEGVGGIIEWINTNWKIMKKLPWEYNHKI